MRIEVVESPRLKDLRHSSLAEQVSALPPHYCAAAVGGGEHSVPPLAGNLGLLEGAQQVSALPPHYRAAEAVAGEHSVPPLAANLGLLEEAQQVSALSRILAPGAACRTAVSTDGCRFFYFYFLFFIFYFLFVFLNAIGMSTCPLHASTLARNLAVSSLLAIISRATTARSRLVKGSACGW